MRRVLEERATSNNPHRGRPGDPLTKSLCLLTGKYYAKRESTLHRRACQWGVGSIVGSTQRLSDRRTAQHCDSHFIRPSQTPGPKLLCRKLALDQGSELGPRDARVDFKRRGEGGEGTLRTASQKTRCKPSVLPANEYCAVLARPTQ